MDPKAFFTSSRVLIVAGKGGVGKTTVSAVLAKAAAATGLTVRVVAIDEESPLGGLLGLPAPLGPKVVKVTPQISAQLVTPMQALDDYLRDHGLRGVTSQLARLGILDVVASAAPGIDDILVLAKIKQLDKQRVADLIIVDAPAAGHAIPFLRAPRALREIISVGPVNTQAVEAGELLADASRCQVMLVTLAEETPVNEAIETAFALEEDIGVALAPVVVNALYPSIDGLVPLRTKSALAAAARFRLARLAAQEEHRARLVAGLPLPQLVLPFVFDADLSAAGVDRLAAGFMVQVESL